MLSQFAGEEEVLFPPCTMLTVIRPEREEGVGGGGGEGGGGEGGGGGGGGGGDLLLPPGGGGESILGWKEEYSGGKRFQAITVRPTFV